MGSDFLTLDPAEAPPRGKTAWLAQQLRSAITDGTLTPGTRLPASRILAGELSLARGTVVEAYRRLTEEGLVAANRGGGTEVARVTALRVAETAPEPEDAAPAKELLSISAG